MILLYFLAFIATEKRSVVKELLFNELLSLFFVHQEEGEKKCSRKGIVDGLFSSYNNFVLLFLNML